MLKVNNYVIFRVRDAGRHVCLDTSKYSGWLGPSLTFILLLFYFFPNIHLLTVLMQ